RDHAGLAGLAQPVEPLALVARRRLVLCLAQSLELVAREQLRVAPDDLGALRDLLLADAHGAALLGALEQVALEAGLVIGWLENRCDAHGRRGIYLCGASRRTTSSSCSRRNGLGTTPSASALVSESSTALPVKSTIGAGCLRSRSERISAMPSSAPTWTSSRNRSTPPAAIASSAAATLIASSTS